MRAQFLKEERKKPVCHGLWAPHLRRACPRPERSAHAAKNRCILLVRSADISTEHSPNGSHRSPIKHAIMVNMLSVDSNCLSNRRRLYESLGCVGTYDAH